MIYSLADSLNSAVALVLAATRKPVFTTFRGANVVGRSSAVTGHDILKGSQVTTVFVAAGNGRLFK